jgi:hypothetical protein
VNVPLLQPAQHNWHCPMCHSEHVTHEHRPHTPLHQCARLRGAWAPFVPAGVKANLVVNERQDYLGTDIPQTDGEGRVVMSVTTQRDDGEDCHIFAPCAVLKVGGALAAAR